LSESPEELKERSTGLMYTMRALFPEMKIAPWMSVLSRQEAAISVVMGMMADLNEEIERRHWMDTHPENGHDLTEEEKAEVQAEEFDMAKTRGAAGILAFALKSLDKHTLNKNVSVGGLGRKQATHTSAAQKSGIVTEPKKRTLLEKATGRGKDKEMTGP
jgi:hypothetical protein